MKKLLKPLIILFMVLLFVNLVWTVGFLETAPLYWFSNPSSTLPIAEVNTTVTTPAIDLWAIRGQIGDIMSGHFSALAFLAVALSIIYQSEANEQMRESIDKQEKAIQQQDTSIERQTEANLDQAKSTLQQAEAIELQATSIEQQNEALKIQSETLQAQIKELEEARKESSKQTEEFAINNINVKLDRYYRLFNAHLNAINDEVLDMYVRARKVLSKHGDNTMWRSRLAKSENTIMSVISTLNFIHDEIVVLKMKYPDAYTVFIKELELILISNHILQDIRGTLEDADKKCQAFKLLG